MFDFLAMHWEPAINVVSHIEADKDDLAFLQTTDKEVIVAVRDFILCIILIVELFGLGTRAAAFNPFELFVSVDAAAAAWVARSL